MAKIMDEAMRRKLAGLLPFAPGSYARWTPKEFDFLDEKDRPVFLVRYFSSETMVKYRESVANPAISAADAFRDSLTSDALGGWENLTDLGTGLPIPHSREAVLVLPDLLATVLWKRCFELSNGPTEEEKTGLESSPPPASEQ